jgi:hypothetical protein
MINSDSVANQGRDCTSIDKALAMGTVGFAIATGVMIMVGNKEATAVIGGLAATCFAGLVSRGVYQCNEGVRTACQNLAAKAKQLFCCQNAAAAKTQEVADQALSEFNSSENRV